jgi:hypothetical protein
MNEQREIRDYLVRQFTLQVGRRDSLRQDRPELSRDELSRELERLNNVVEFLQSEFQRLEN